MKFIKKFSILVIVLFVSIAFVACGNNDNNNKATYTVTFKVDDTVYEIKQVNSGDKVSKPITDPSKTDWRFVGWYNGDTEWNFNENVINSDITLIAKFAIVDTVGGYSIRLDCFEIKNDGNEKYYYKTVSNSKTIYNFNDDIEVDENLTWFASYDIAGTDKIESKRTELLVGDNEFYLVVKDKSENVKQYIIVVRRKPTYVVSFNTLGGSSIPTQTVEEGSLATMPSVNVIREGYTFNKWNFDFSTPITSNIEIKAEYKLRSYTATFIADEQIVATRTFTMEDGFIDSIPKVPYKEGFNGSWESYKIVPHNITIEAIYGTISYKAIFEADGKVVAEKYFTVLDDRIMGAPTSVPYKNGYIGVWEDYIIKAENITIKAIYTAKTYTATFIADGVTVGTSLYTVEDIIVKDLPSIPDRVGYEGKWENYKIKAENMTINAEYIPIDYIATFKVDGVEVDTRTFTIEDEKIKNMPAVPKKEGFAGKWGEYTIKPENIEVNAIYRSKYDDDGFKAIVSKDGLIEYISDTANYTVNARLYEDIDLEDEEWIPIGNKSVPYSAKFDGNGYTVSNYVISTKREYNGFFGYVTNAEIKDVNIENISITGTSNNYTNAIVGGLAGYVYNSRVENCHTSGKIEISTSNILTVGGLIGNADCEVTIIDSDTTCELTTSSVTVNTGGIVGYLRNSTIISSYSDSNIRINCSNYAYVGGIVGLVDSEDNQMVLISNTYAKTSLVVNSECIQAGGLIGCSNNSLSITMVIISNCYTTGNVVGNSTDGDVYVGGLVGFTNNSIIANCYSMCNVSANSDNQTAVAGGIIGEIQIANEYSIAKISCNYSTGNISSNTNISGANSIAGGIIGEYYNSNGYNIEMTNCYAVGNVIASSKMSALTSFAGGLIGNALQDVDISSNCYRYSGQVIKSTNNIDSSIENGKIREEGTVLSLQDIWGQLSKIWNGQVWNLYNDKNPTLKQELMIYENFKQEININSKEDLLSLSGNFIINSVIKLNANLDLNEAEITPIYLLDSSFEGKGNIISNFKLTAGNVYNGFMGFAINSEVKNLGLENYSINCGYIYSTYVGGLVGYLKNSIVSSCYTDNCAIISNSLEDSYVGGIAGYIRSTSITNCYSSCEITATVEGSTDSDRHLYYSKHCYAGGIAGLISNSSVGNCYATGNVSSVISNNTWTYAFAGGLIGDSSYDNYGDSLILKNCYATGNVSAIAKTTSDIAFSNTGGLIGESELNILDIINCYRYSQQDLISDGNENYEEIYDYGTSADMETIWAFVSSNWDSNVWEFYTDKNPVLKI